jgi:hypothetical protein
MPTVFDEPICLVCLIGGGFHDYSCSAKPSTAAHPRDLPPDEDPPARVAAEDQYYRDLIGEPAPWRELVAFDPLGFGGRRP